MASRYFVSGGVDNNWGTTGNWSLTDGGAGGQAVPLATDDVFFTSNSPACTVNASARVALSLTFTGYTNTITMTNQITVSGNVTLVSAMTISGSGALLVNATATLTSNGKAWPNAMTLSTAATMTLADNWTVQGLLTLGSTTATTTINGSQITASGGLTMGGTAAVATGTTTLLFNGTGTITSNSSGSLRLATTINTSGTITFATGNFSFNGVTLTYTAGTISYTAGAKLFVSTNNTTLAISGMTWPDVTISGAITVTLNENLNISGSLTLGQTTSATVINGNQINVSGGYRYNGTSGSISGTTIVALVGTGTVDAPSATTGRLLLPLRINTSGTITVTSPVYVDLAVLTYTAGTVVTDTTWSGAASPLRSIVIRAAGSY